MLLQERARSRRFKLVSKDGDFTVEQEAIPAAAPQQFVRRWASFSHSGAFLCEPTLRNELFSVERLGTHYELP